MAFMLLRQINDKDIIWNRIDGFLALFKRCIPCIVIIDNGYYLIHIIIKL